jgi:hypothetical protein
VIIMNELIEQIEENVFIKIKNTLETDDKKIKEALKAILLDNEGQPKNNEYLNKDFTITVKHVPFEDLEELAYQSTYFIISCRIISENDNTKLSNCDIKYSFQYRVDEIDRDVFLSFNAKNYDDAKQITDIESIYPSHCHFITNNQVVLSDKKKNHARDALSTIYDKEVKKQKKEHNFFTKAQSLINQKIDYYIEIYLNQYQHVMSSDNEEDLLFTKHSGLQLLLSIKNIIETGLITDIDCFGSYPSLQSQLMNVPFVIDYEDYKDDIDFTHVSSIHTIALNKGLMVIDISRSGTTICPFGDLIDDDTYNKNHEAAQKIIDAMLDDDLKLIPASWDTDNNVFVCHNLGMSFNYHINTTQQYQIHLDDDCIIKCKMPPQLLGETKKLDESPAFN